jgi:hypothetical protein
MLRAEQFASAKGAFKAGRGRESAALARGSQTGDVVLIQSSLR